MDKTLFKITSFVFHRGKKKSGLERDEGWINDRISLLGNYSFTTWRWMCEDGLFVHPLTQYCLFKAFKPDGLGSFIVIFMLLESNRTFCILKKIPDVCQSHKSILKTFTEWHSNASALEQWDQMHRFTEVQFMITRMVYYSLHVKPSDPAAACDQLNDMDTPSIYRL